MKPNRPLNAALLARAGSSQIPLATAEARRMAYRARMPAIRARWSSEGRSEPETDKSPAPLAEEVCFSVQHSATAEVRFHAFLRQIQKTTENTGSCCIHAGVVHVYAVVAKC
jgi:hypothetical protein